MITVIAVALATATSSAPAATRAPLAPVAAPTVRALDDGGAARSSAPTRYCVVSSPTGTRIPRRDCRTRAEWMQSGFDPLDKD